MAGLGCPGREERMVSLGTAELECGDVSASQEDLLARSSFLGGGGGAEEEAEEFSTLPLTHQDQQQQGQGKGEEEEDAITMCTLPSTQPSPPPPPADEDEEDEEAEDPRHSTPQKRRICTRKVRGARTSTPTPSPDGRRRSRTSFAVDPLCWAVLMIPARKTATSADPCTDDILALARHRGIF